MKMIFKVFVLSLLIVGMGMLFSGVPEKMIKDVNVSLEKERLALVLLEFKYTEINTRLIDLREKHNELLQLRNDLEEAILHKENAITAERFAEAQKKINETYEKLMKVLEISSEKTE